MAKQVCSTLREITPRPEAESRNLRHTFLAISVYVRIGSSPGDGALSTEECILMGTELRESHLWPRPAVSE